jgi:putative hydrolase of the HAD superfamily
MTRTVLWDFDGTLAHRPGRWSGCLVETLDEHEPDHGLRIEDLRPCLRSAFPWDEPERAHPELSDPEAWWGHVSGLLEGAYVAAGIEQPRAAALAGLARRRYVDPSHGWQVYPDTVPALAALGRRGWRHVVLSNHVPELPRMIAALGLGDLVDAVVTSAEIGYEKPHPEAYACAQRVCGGSAGWMVGDNYEADVAGAEAVGLRAVLVRSENVRATRYAPDLFGVARFLG